MVQPVSNKMARFIETDISTRIFRLSSGVNEALMTAANEPSLGLYRLQEHSVGTIPKLIKEKQNLDEMSERVKGVNFDLSYDIEAIRDVSRVTNFDTILFDVRKAIEIKQKLTRRELENRQRARLEQSTTLPTRGGYGSTGESPPIGRRAGTPYSINATPTHIGSGKPVQSPSILSSYSATPPQVGSGKGYGIVIEPKTF